MDEAGADRDGPSGTPEYPEEPGLRQGELDLGSAGRGPGPEETERKPDPQGEGDNREAPSSNRTGRAPAIGEQEPDAEDADERAAPSAEERDTGGWY